MVAQIAQAGRVPDEAWEFVDGVPEGPIEVERGTVRGGIVAEGEDVGQHTSIAVNAQGEPMVSYYDADGASLRFAARFGGAWTHYQVDAGSAISDPELGGAEVGKYTSITLDGQGRPGIAYYATFYDTGGVGRSEVRFARARTAQPAGATDWDFFTVDMVALPPVPADEDPPVIPEGVGLFLSSARRVDGSPVLAYYDRPNGDLKLVTFDPASDTFAAPQIVDGADGSDVGWYPSVAVDPTDQIHLSYVDAGRDNLIYCNLTDRLPAIVDDGYRIDGQTSDGLDVPVFHFVGDDSGIIANGALLAIAYQDATSHELLLSHWDPVDMVWKIDPVAGAEDPFAGAYGFYASAELDVDDVVISTYVIDPRNHDAWVEVFRVRITEG
jgi:hypothetical protein